MPVLCLTVDKLHYVPSLDVEACFTYTANPKSYAPSLSKLSHLYLY